MAAYSRPVVRRDTESFPQANSLGRLVELLEISSTAKIDEPELAALWGITARQGAYYFAAASYLKLAYKRGGWIRPTPEGVAILALQGEVRNDAMADTVFERPIFLAVARILANTGEMPTVPHIADMIRTEDANLNEFTSERRAETVQGWISTILSTSPEKIQALEDGPVMSIT